MPAHCSLRPPCPTCGPVSGWLSFILGPCCLPVTLPVSWCSCPLGWSPHPPHLLSGQPSLHPSCCPRTASLRASPWQGSSCRPQGRGRCAHVPLTAKPWQEELSSAADTSCTCQRMAQPRARPGSSRTEGGHQVALRVTSSHGPTGITGGDDALASSPGACKASRCSCGPWQGSLDERKLPTGGPSQYQC